MFFGRFINEDPIKDGTNWYAYCGNNPLMFVDPSGLYQLEVDSNGNVYAIIEGGDTLSEIAEAEVNDASAWDRIHYRGDPNELQIGERIDISGLYNEAYPQYNVIIRHVTPNGEIKGVYYKSLMPSSYIERCLEDDEFFYVMPGFIYVTSKEAVGKVQEMEKEYYDFIFSIAAGTKMDIKQVNQAAKAAGITSPEVRKAFGRYIESLKGGKRNDVNFSWRELVELAKEFLE